MRFAKLRHSLKLLANRLTHDLKIVFTVTQTLCYISLNIVSGTQEILLLLVITMSPWSEHCLYSFTRYPALLEVLCAITKMLAKYLTILSTCKQNVLASWHWRALCAIGLCFLWENNPYKGPMMLSFEIFAASINTLLNKHSRYWWFETP